jgi:hypothetical protein
MQHQKPDGVLLSGFFTMHAAVSLPNRRHPNSEIARSCHPEGAFFATEGSLFGQEEILRSPSRAHSHRPGVLRENDTKLRHDLYIMMAGEAADR